MSDVFRGIKKAFYGRRRLYRMQNSIRDAVIPLYGNDFQKRVYISPSGYRDENVIRVLTAVKYIHIVKIKIDNIDLRMVLPEVVAELINIMTPSAVHKHQILAVKI